VNDRIETFCRNHPRFSPEAILLFAIDITNCIDQDKDGTDVSEMESMLTRYMEATMRNIENTIEQVAGKAAEEAAEKAMEKAVATLPSVKDIEQVVSSRDATSIVTEGLKSTIELALVDSMRKDPVAPMIMTRLNAIQDAHVISGEKMETMARNMGSLTDTHGKLHDMAESLEKYLDRLRAPAKKGRDTEELFLIMLQRDLPMHEITAVPSRNQKGRMDITISRDGYPSILVDSKDYTSTVGKSEVEKFERDILLSENHGIMISPHSGIVNRRHFQITMVGGCLGVYLCNTGMDTTDLVNAVNIIYDIHSTMSVEKEKGVLLSTANLDKINGIIAENMATLASVKSHLSLAESQCAKITFTSIRQLLGIGSSTSTLPLPSVPSSSEGGVTCDGCSRSFASGKSLSNHRRHCQWTG